MRSLIGKVIEIKGDSLKEIPDNGSDSPVVVFTQTKDFSVTKQRKATFNIINPRKVIFMGSAGADDSTTRAERREEELEKRRARRNKTGASFLGATDSEASRGGRGGRLGGITNRIKSALAPFFSLAGQLLTTMGAVLSLEFLRSPMQFLRRIRSLATTGATAAARLVRGAISTGRGAFNLLTRSRTMPGMKPKTPKLTPEPKTGRFRDPKTGRFMKAADAAGDATAKTGRVAKFLTSGTKLARFARLALGGSTFGLSLLAEYLIYDSAAQLDKLTGMMEENNRALNAMPGDRKEKFQKENSGMSVHEYHESMMKLFGNHFPKMLQEINDEQARRGEDLTSPAEFMQALQPEVKYALPHKLSNLTFNAGSFAEMVELHAKAAVGPDAFDLIDPKHQQKINIRARQQKIGRPQQQEGFSQSTVDFLGIGPKADVVNFRNDTYVPPSSVTVPAVLRPEDSTNREGNQMPLDNSPILIPVPAGANPNTFPNPNIPDFGGGILSSRDPNAKDLRDIAIGNNHVPNNFVVA